jgi:imidazolonepropionase-like amidohydrolase
VPLSLVQEDLPGHKAPSGARAPIELEPDMTRFRAIRRGVLPHAALLLAPTLFTASAAVAQPPARPALGEGVRPFVTVDAPVVALVNTRLIDGTGAPPRAGQTIVIRGALIEAVGATAAVAVPAGAHVIDLAGHTVLPGFVQLHEHTWLGGLRVSAPMAASAYLYLAAGVTTAMTAGSQRPYDELNLKRAIDAGILPGPRLLITGPYLRGGAPAPGANSVALSAADVRRVVDYWADEGATWFKVINGPADVVRWTVEAAHARGLRVTAHLCSVTFAEAAALGVDALQHGFITNSEYVPGRRPGECPADNQRAQADVDVASPAVQADIRRIVAGGAAVVSTLGVYESFNPERARLDPRAMETLHPEARREIEQNHAGLAASGFVVPERLLRKMMQWERDFVDAGGLLGAGSDPWGTGFMPGFGNLRNYELLVEAGFTPEAAIRIMTLNGAAIVGESARLGSVVEGKVADLVVVRGDPAARPAAIHDVVSVFRDGVGFDSARLREAVRGRVGAY